MYKYRARFINKHVEARFNEIVGGIITSFVDFGPGYGPSGDPDLDFWEEYKDQVQNCPNIFFKQYVDQLRDTCTFVVGDMDRFERKLLWLWCENYRDWDEEKDPDFWTEDLEAELFNRIEYKAMNEPLRASQADDDAEEPSSELMRGLLPELKGFALKIGEELCSRTEISGDAYDIVIKFMDALADLPRLPDTTAVSITITVGTPLSIAPVMRRFVINREIFSIDSTMELVPGEPPDVLFRYSYRYNSAESYACAGQHLFPDVNRVSEIPMRYATIEDASHNIRVGVVIGNGADGDAQETLF